MQLASETSHTCNVEMLTEVRPICDVLMFEVTLRVAICRADMGCCSADACLTDWACRGKLNNQSDSITLHTTSYGTRISSAISAEISSSQARQTVFLAAAGCCSHHLMLP